MLHRDCGWHSGVLAEPAAGDGPGSGPFRNVFRLYLRRVYGAGVGRNAAFSEVESQQG